MAEAVRLYLKMLEPVVGFSSFLVAVLSYSWIDLIGIFPETTKKLATTSCLVDFIYSKVIIYHILLLAVQIVDRDIASMRNQEDTLEDEPLRVKLHILA